MSQTKTAVETYEITLSQVEKHYGEGRANNIRCSDS